VSSVRRAAALALCIVAGTACDSQPIDGSDLRGLFASASAPTLARPAPVEPAKSKKKGGAADDLPPMPPATERLRVPGPCMAPEGEAAPRDPRNGRRPACRRAEILEHEGPQATPRYACVFRDGGAEKRKPLPLVVFLHSEFDDPTAVAKKTRLRTRYAKLDLSGDPARSGFVILAPQARRFKGLLRWDVQHHVRDNQDAVAINHFIDDLVKEGAVDPRQVYFLGDSQGGVMAAVYAHLYPERVAAYGVYGADASRLEWTCDGTPPPAAIVYRSCDRATPCADVERWLSRRDEARAPTFSLRLGAGKATEPSCVLAKHKCSERGGLANHARWPKPREGEMLEYLSRFSFKD
jgi:dienelactone hydrolase